MADQRVFPDRTALAASAAGHIAAVLREAIAFRGAATLVLAGGSTPEPVYRLLAQEGHDDLDWAKVWVLFGDERAVPPDHPESNYAMARRTLLDPLGLADGQVLRIEGERGAEAAATRYADRLRAQFGPELPVFDLVLLGLGSDGHTASLFPGAAALAETKRWAVAAEAPPEHAVRERVTLALPVLNAAREVLFLVSGASKQDALRRTLDGDLALPATHVRLAGVLRWFVDADARGASD